MYFCQAFRAGLQVKKKIWNRDDCQCSEKRVFSTLQVRRIFGGLNVHYTIITIIIIIQSYYNHSRHHDYYICLITGYLLQFFGALLWRSTKNEKNHWTTVTLSPSIRRSKTGSTLSEWTNPLWWVSSDLVSRSVGQYSPFTDCVCTVREYTSIVVRQWAGQSVSRSVISVQTLRRQKGRVHLTPMSSFCPCLSPLSVSPAPGAPPSLLIESCSVNCWK